MSELRKRNRSCNECTRRRTRCDGGVPCENCKQHLMADKCIYRQRNRRTNPSWKTVSNLSEALQIHDDVFKQLIQLVDYSTVPEQTKQQINRLASTGLGQIAPSPDATIDSVLSPATTSDPLQDEETGDHEWTETYDAQGDVVRVGDDVNGLAPRGRNKSYMGVFSPGAVLRILCAVSPEVKDKFTQLEQLLIGDKNVHTLMSNTKSAEASTSNPDVPPKPSFNQQMSAIDAYFARIHVIMPMVDETWFRSTFAEQNRTENSWVALSNTILALGSIATGDDEAHLVYHRHAREAIGYNVFCSGNLEMLQALILLGGLYLHYANSPNSGYLVRGTAFRMAVAMGLHRESVVSAQANTEPWTTKQQRNHRIPRAELLRRTWWSLVNADVLAGLLIGRPKPFGWDPRTMDIRLPSMSLGNSLDTSHQPHGSDDATNDEWVARAFRLQAEFSSTLSQKQERMARLAQLTAQEIVTIHEELQAWVRSHLHTFNFEPSCPKIVRRYLEWQNVYCLGACMTFSQPHLLYLAVDHKDQGTMTPEDWRVIGICQNTASQIIAAISANNWLDRIMVWHSTFSLFQACLILLLSMALSPRLNTDQATVHGWKESLETARQSFKQMAPYTRRSDRYGEIFEGLYDVVIAIVDGEQQRSMRYNYDHPPYSATPASTDTELWLHMQTADLAYDGFPYAFDLDFDFSQPLFEGLEFYQPPSEQNTPRW